MRYLPRPQNITMGWLVNAAFDTMQSDSELAADLHSLFSTGCDVPYGSRHIHRCVKGKWRLSYLVFKIPTANFSRHYHGVMTRIVVVGLDYKTKIVGFYFADWRDIASVNKSHDLFRECTFAMSCPTMHKLRGYNWPTENNVEWIYYVYSLAKNYFFAYCNDPRLFRNICFNFDYLLVLLRRYSGSSDHPSSMHQLAWLLAVLIPLPLHGRWMCYSRTMTLSRLYLPSHHPLFL
jgi:hypothetical protein